MEMHMLGADDNDDGQGKGHMQLSVFPITPSNNTSLDILLDRPNSLSFLF